MNLSRATMTTSTGVKVIVVAVTIMLFIGYVLSSAVQMTDLQVQYTERFSNPTEPSVKDVSDERLALFQKDHRSSVASIYDKYYTSIYEKLFDEHKWNLVEFECYDLQYRTKLEEYGSKAVLLDVGCGTGEHLKCITTDNKRIQVYGLDQSEHMLDCARGKLDAYNNRVRFVQGDFNNPRAVYEKMFTHITCYYFSFYYAKDTQTFFKNCHRWLKTRGHLCVHVVHPENFNPIGRVANPIKGISLQNYMKKRKTDYKVYFNDFVYRSDFKYSSKTNRAVLYEKFIYPKKNKVRQHTHKMIMPHHETIIQTARKCGFQLKHITKMYEIGQDNEYLCYFQKS